MPERVIFVHVQRARNAHTATRRLLHGKALAVEQQVLFKLVQVRHFARLAGIARAFFAAVARDETTILTRGRVHAKVIDGEQARV